MRGGLAVDEGSHAEVGIGEAASGWEGGEVAVVGEETEACIHVAAGFTGEHGEAGGEAGGGVGIAIERAIAACCAGGEGVDGIGDEADAVVAGADVGELVTAIGAGGDGFDEGIVGEAAEFDGEASDAGFTCVLEAVLVGVSPDAVADGGGSAGGIGKGGLAHAEEFDVSAVGVDTEAVDGLIDSEGAGADGDEPVGLTGVVGRGKAGIPIVRGAELNGVGVGYDVTGGVERGESGGGIAEAFGHDDDVVDVVGEVEHHVVLGVAVWQGVAAAIVDVVVEVGVGRGAGSEEFEGFHAEAGEGLFDARIDDAVVGGGGADVDIADGAAAAVDDSEGFGDALVEDVELSELKRVGGDEGDTGGGGGLGDGGGAGAEDLSAGNGDVVATL